MRSALSLFFAVLISLFFFAFPKSALAQTASVPATISSSPTTTSNSFNAPNFEPNVARNQHTYAQSVMIEVLSAVYCQLTGIDPMSPQGCLGINPATGKLGYAPQEIGKEQKIGGLLGATSGMIATLYTPTVSTSEYVHYLSDNFGIVKSAHAQVEVNGYGYEGLRPVLELWKVVRNLAYFLLVLAFIFIGVGIMLRVKIDPRTVMGIQNQLPKVIMAIILITFSYAIAAIMVDLTWTTTYTGIAVLTSANDPTIDTADYDNCKPASKGGRLSEKAVTNILQTPITFFHQIFAKCDTSELSNDEAGGSDFGNAKDGGFRYITTEVSGAVGQIVENVARNLFLSDDDTDCSLFHPVKCAKLAAANVIGYLVSFTMLIVIFVVLLVALLRTWFQLIKAYIYTLIYVVTGPIFIVFGLLPQKPWGFEKWLRALFVNLAVFPLTAMLFVGARLLLDLYGGKEANKFIPPLVGNPTANTNFGALLALGVVLIIPSVNTILKEKMGVKGIGSPGLVAAGIAGGAAVIGAPVGRAIKHLNRYDVRTGDIGALAKIKRTAGEKTLNVASKAHVPFAQKALDERKELRTRGQLHDLNARREEGKSKPNANGGNGRRTWKSRVWGRNKKNGDDNGSGGPTGGSPATPPKTPKGGPGGSVAGTSGQSAKPITVQNVNILTDHLSTTQPAAIQERLRSDSGFRQQVETRLHNRLREHAPEVLDRNPEETRRSPAQSAVRAMDHFKEAVKETEKTMPKKT